MNDSRTKSPSHDTVRTFLRIAGPLVALTGLVFTGIGIGSFFAEFGTFEPPRYFWCAFVGMPLIGLGMIMTKFGYLGAILSLHRGRIDARRPRCHQRPGRGDRPGRQSDFESGRGRRDGSPRGIGPIAVILPE